MASLALLPVAAVSPVPMVTDMAMAFTFTVHSHWGLEQVSLINRELGRNFSGKKTKYFTYKKSLSKDFF